MHSLQNLSSFIPPSFTNYWNNQPRSSLIQLKEAIFNGNLEVTQDIISKDPSLLKSTFTDGMLPLQAAVRLKQVSITQFLVFMGADVSIKDFQGMSALDYAAVAKDTDLIRILLSSSVVNQIEATRKKINQFQCAGALQTERFLKIISIFNEDSSIQSNSEIKHLTKAILAGHSEKIDVLLLKVNDFNLCDERGISPMHAAVVAKDYATLQKMVAKQGDLLRKNKEGIAPADLLFKGVEKIDPMNQQKIQALLGLLSLANILATTYVMPALSSEAASFWTAGLMLLNVGAELSLSYHAYLQLSPESVWEKVFYWAGNLAIIPAFSLLNKVPVAKIAWDVWRTSAVCRRAFTQLQVAYNNFSYDKLRVMKMVSTQILIAGTTVYHTQNSFKALIDFPDPKQFQEKLSKLDHDKVILDQDREKLGQDKVILDQDRKKFGQDKVILDQDREKLGQDKVILDQDREILDQDKVILDQDREKLGNDRDKLENRRIEINVEIKKERSLIANEKQSIDQKQIALKQDSDALNESKKKFETTLERFKQMYIHPIIPHVFKKSLATNNSDLLTEKIKNYLCLFFADEVKPQDEIYYDLYNLDTFKRKYRKLSLLFHSDKSPQLEDKEMNSLVRARSAEIFTKITAAYEFFTNSNKESMLQMLKSGQYRLAYIKTTCG